MNGDKKCQIHVDEAVDILESCNIKSRNIRRFLNLVNLYISQVYISNLQQLRQCFSIEEMTHIFSIYKVVIYSIIATLVLQTNLQE